MPCHTRMKTILLQGVLWLCLFNFGFVICVIEPGYLDFDNLPDTNFSCVGKVIGGYYADLEASCQMFHVCTIGQLDEPMDIRFLCLNGTVFDQETRVCERVDEVDCSKSEGFYHLNLELYGNTAPPIVEESGNTEPSIISSTTPTTTSRPTSTSRTTRASYFTTPVPTVPPTTHSTPKVITSNHFPINSGPDIRFNPEEINIRLTPGSPPIIKSPSVSFQQQSFNGNGRLTVTTHSTVYKNEGKQKIITTTQKPKSIVSYGLQHTLNKPSYQRHNFDYSYQNTENSDVDYHTDLPSSEYTDLGFDGHMHFESTNQKKTYSASTTKRIENKPYVVSSTNYPSSTKPRPQVNYQRTDKPPNLQLPVPIFPTFSPLTFSSPAPFSLTRHIETKRSNDHQQRPRIVVSASASVSDASGRRLNYSLGTIGQHILGEAPHSYDEYKESDVGKDPFYLDVPRVANKPRHKRDLEEENNAKEVTSTEENEQTTHWIPPDYVDDNYEPLTYNNTAKNLTEEATKEPIVNKTKTADPEYEYYYEYIDDNYEPSVYDNPENRTTNTDSILTTIESSTESSSGTITQETTLESNTVTESINRYQTDTSEAISTTITEKEIISTDQTEKDELTTANVETTTVPMETTTDEQQNTDSQLANESKYNIESISTTESATVSTYYSSKEQIITTPPTTTENYDTTTESDDFITPKIETTTEIFNNESTTQLPEVTTEMFEYTTKNAITTQKLDEFNVSKSERGTTEMNEVETVTATDSVVKETTTDVSVASPTSTTSRYPYFKSRNPGVNRFSRTKPTSRHRFSSPSIQMSQSVLKLHENKLVNPPMRYSSSEEVRSEIISHRLNKIIPESKLHSTTFLYDDVSLTDAPLSKSANPTESKNTKSPLSTTPITRTTYFIPRRFTYDTRKGFNCFGRKLNEFYEDARDCRLFHYCTPGYTETQVLDMKFVCDYGTYFDSDKLICTKIKPRRCK